MKKNGIIWLVALGLTTISLLVQLSVPGTIHQDEQSWQKKYDLHTQSGAFKVRPFTTRTMALLHDRFQIPYKTSFFSLQFLLLLLSGPAFSYYLSRIDFSDAQCLAGMAIYYLCLPVFLAHLQPNHLWDDFWVYLMLPLSFGLALSRRFLPAVLTMAWAVLARETTIIFLPFWFMVIRETQDKKKLARGLYMVGSVILIFVVARLMLTGLSAGNPKFNLFFNFENALRTRDTIFSILASLGFLWITGLWAALKGSVRFWPCLNTMRWGAVLTVLAYTSSTLLIARARESRLFFPPYIFLIPLTFIYFDNIRDTLRPLFSRKNLVKTLLFMTIVLSLSIKLAFTIFPTFEYRAKWPGNQVYLGIHLAIVLCFVAAESYRSFRAAAPINGRQTGDTVRRQP